MTVESKPSHPVAETIAMFAEGKLPRAAVAELLVHLDGCASCRNAVTAASDAHRDEVPHRGISTWWLAAVAAVLVVGVTAAAFFPIVHRSETARLAKLLPADRRLIEPRLAGDFGWAPYRGPQRAAGEEADRLQLKLGGAAADLAERADRDRSAASQHDAGVAMLLAERSTEAVTRLRDAAAKNPHDATTWSDLAAAEYAEALQAGRPSLYPQALADADHSLRLDGHRKEALFNRALILERLGLVSQADAAWQRYLAVDSSSPWAAEARAHVSKLPPQNSDARFLHELPRLERAVAANDGTAVRRFVEAWPLQSRVYCESDWLGQWGNAFAHGDEAHAAELLARCRAIGHALMSTSDESLLADSVAVIDAADAARRARLAGAHALYRAGRVAYGAWHPNQAEPQLREAAAELTALGSPMALEARDYAACVRFDRNDVDGARAELETLLAAHPGQSAVKAQIEWELGLCYMTAGDWTAALPILSDAERTFVRLREHNNAAFVETLLADTLGALGRPDPSWATRIRSFSVLAIEGRDTRLAVSIGAASRGELLIGNLDAARAMLHVEEEASRDDILLADALTREIVLAAKLGDLAEARRARDELAVAAMRIADPAMRTRAFADADFANGAFALLDGDAADAKARLGRAIGAYRADEHPLNLPESLLLRARAERRLGDDASAAHDLQDAASTLERSPVRVAGTLVGTGIFDAGNAIYDDAIALSLDRGDANAAFAYAERARAALARNGTAVADARTMQQRLVGTRTAVAEIDALPDEVVEVCVTAERIEAARHRIARERIAGLDSSALYDILIRPLQSSLNGVRQLIVVTGPRLAAIPFAALYDTNQRAYLVERMTVATAPTAGALRRDAIAAPPHDVLAVLLPSGEAAGAAALPQAEAEVQDLRTVYGTAAELAPQSFQAFAVAARRAEVIHIAGHTMREAGAGEDALVFAGQSVIWSSIAAMHLQRTRVIVLAACETLRAPDEAGARALSLGRGFLAAGARNVIGTLTPIADDDARALFGELHRQLAAGMAPADALRETQMKAIAGRGPQAWKALAIVTTRIAV